MSAEKKDRLLEVIKNKSDQLEAEHKARLKGDLSVRSDAQHPSFTESAYKEFEAKPKKCICYDPKECMQFGCQYPGPVESPEPQEKGHDCEFFLVTDVSVYACECDPHHILIDDQEYVAVNKITKAKPVSVPSESQEDFAISFAKFCQVDLKGRTFNDLMSEFKATRKPE